MTRCEQHELQISALLDGEADLHEQKAVLDHLLGCADCRRFYEESGSFQDLVGELPLEADGPVASRPAPKSRRRFQGHLPSWAQAAALLLVLALGIVLGLGAGALTGAVESSGELVMPSAEHPIELQLASEVGSMSDARFMSLTLDLLRADTRYQRKMFEILRILGPDDPQSTEGGFDRAIDREGAELSAQRILSETDSVSGPADGGRRSIY